MKRWRISKKIAGKSGDLDTSKFCAQVLVGSPYFATILKSKDDWSFSSASESPVRNGTITFFKFKGEYFAATCLHVIDALVSTNKSPEVRDPQLLFIHRDNIYHHFNYELFPVPKDHDDHQPDVVIGRIEKEFVDRINCDALTLKGHPRDLKFAIATGYPERSREIRQHIETFSVQSICISFVASIQFNNRHLLLHDRIKDHPDHTNNLSGISGGPILWSRKDNIGLLGISSSGYDLGVAPDGFQHPKIFIFGEYFSLERALRWIEGIPAMSKTKDQSKQVYIPQGFE